MSGLLERLQSKKGGRRSNTAAGKVVRPDGERTETLTGQTIVVEAPVKLDDLSVVSLGGTPPRVIPEKPPTLSEQPPTAAPTAPDKTPPWLADGRRVGGTLNSLVPRALAVIEERGQRTPLTTGDVSALRLAVDTAAQSLTREMRLSADDRSLAVSEMSEFLWGYGPLTPLFEDTAVTDIWVDRFDSISCRRRGEIFQSPFQFRTPEMYHRFVERITGRQMGRESVDQMSLSLTDRWHTRLEAAFPPLVYGNEPRLGFRIPRVGHPTLYELVRSKMLPVKFGAWLAEAAHSGAAHIVVVGPPGSGRTTLVSALLGAIGSVERLATIETVAEIFPPVVTIDKLVGPSTRQEELVSLAGRRAAARLALGDIGAAGGAPFRAALRNGWCGIIGCLDAPDTDTAIGTLRSFSALPTTAMIVIEMGLDGGTPCLRRAREIIVTEGTIAAMPTLVTFQGSSEGRRRWEMTSIETPLRRRIVPAGIAPDSPARATPSERPWQRS